MRKPKIAKTFGVRVCRNQLTTILCLKLEHVSRLDIVWDQYLPKSLKEHPRKVQGEGTRRRVLESTTIPRNWVEFLRSSDIKKELFCFIAEKIASNNAGDKQILTIYLDTVLAAHDDGFTDESHATMKKQIL